MILMNPVNLLKKIALFVSIPSLRPSVKRTQQAGLETLLDYERIAYLIGGVRYAQNLTGDYIEFGSFRGGSAAVILQHMPLSKTLYVLDSFEGMPEPSIHDNYHKKGDFSETSFERVVGGLSRLGKNFVVLKGYFEDTIAKLQAQQDLRFSFAHIDVDLFESVNTALNFVYPRMEQGGIIIFDDYHAPTCLGAKKAVDEFFMKRVEIISPLAYPAVGVIKGGGDARKCLQKYLGPLFKLAIIKETLFPIGEKSVSTN